MNNKDLKDIINDSLGIQKENKEILGEAYVSIPKMYQLNTDLLTQKAKAVHMELYEETVKTLNRVNLEVETADKSVANNNHSKYRSLKIDEISNLNSVYLHELYFANIADTHSEITMDSIAFIRLENSYGTFDRWQNDFIACCKCGRDGWAVCGYSIFLRRYMNIFIDGDDTNIPIGFIPVIVIDTHEHAFFKDYLNSKKDYINNMLLELKWEIIESRIEKCDMLNNILSK